MHLPDDLVRRGRRPIPLGGQQLGQASPFLGLYVPERLLGQARGDRGGTAAKQVGQLTGPGLVARLEVGELGRRIGAIGGSPASLVRAASIERPLVGREPIAQADREMAGRNRNAGEQLRPHVELGRARRHAELPAGPLDVPRAQHRVRVVLVDGTSNTAVALNRLLTDVATGPESTPVRVARVARVALAGATDGHARRAGIHAAVAAVRAASRTRPTAIVLHQAHCAATGLRMFVDELGSGPGPVLIVAVAPEGAWLPALAPLLRLLRVVVIKA